MRRLTLLLLWALIWMYGCKDPDIPFPLPVSLNESFDSPAKGSYDPEELELESGPWFFDDVLLGATAQDRFRGLRAARLRESGRMRMEFDIAAARELEFSYASYGDDEPSAWELWQSTNAGRSWRKIAGPEASTNRFQVFRTNLRVEEPVRFELRKLKGAGRLNIDDFRVESGLPALAPGRDDPLALGNPSNATANASDNKNYLMQKAQFALSYNESRGTANWVAWHLSEAWRGPAERQNDFRPDPSLPTGWRRISPGAYTNTGFDRGHMCPSEDRDGSVEDNSATFLMTNILPQSPSNNRVLWKALEAYCRKLSAEGNELYIMAGPLGKGGEGSNGGITQTIDQGNVTVPEAFWKIVLVLPNGDNDLERVTANTRVIAVWVPNDQSASAQDWGEYRTSVKNLERKLGYNFFSLLPRQVEDALEEKTDNGPTK